MFEDTQDICLLVLYDRDCEDEEVQMQINLQRWSYLAWLQQRLQIFSPDTKGGEFNRNNNET